MNFNNCKKCGEFHDLDGKCESFYTVYDPEWLGDGGKDFRASDHEEAAYKYAQYFNESGDYTLMKDSRIIEVEFEGLRKRFEISAEPSIDYNVQEK